MRRILQSQGCEVIHLGHNRSVQEVVDAALEEDVQGVAVSSYQGGHVEYFEYLVESLRAAGADHVKVVGGGGGVIVPAEIERCASAGVTISPEDGQKMGLVGMINSVVADCDFDPWEKRRPRPTRCWPATAGHRACHHGGRDRSVSPTRCWPASARRGWRPAGLGYPCSASPARRLRQVSLTDELVRRFRVDQQDKLRIGVIAVDPTRRKGAGRCWATGSAPTRSMATGSSSAASPPVGPTRCPSTSPT